VRRGKNFAAPKRLTRATYHALLADGLQAIRARVELTPDDALMLTLAERQLRGAKFGRPASMKSIARDLEGC
jgi:hypothetical protein